MNSRYTLAPRAASDLVEIWRHIKRQSNEDVANRVESVIRDKFVFLSATPGAGHWRKDLTPERVKFFTVYSYLVVYRPETTPLQIVTILHGRRDAERLLTAEMTSPRVK